MRDLLIVGAGGFGREVLQYARDAAAAGEPVRVAGFLDPFPEALRGFALNASVLGDPADYAPSPGEELVIALGDPRQRFALADLLRGRGARFGRVVHPRAYVAASATLGEGVVVAPLAAVCPHAVVGAHAALNVACNVGHDVRVGRCAVLSPHAVINGHSVLGDGAFLGSQAVVTARRQVGAWSKVSAGAVVFRDVPEGGLVAGNPAAGRVMFTAPEGWAAGTS